MTNRSAPQLTREFAQNLIDNSKIDHLHHERAVQRLKRFDGEMQKTWRWVGTAFRQESIGRDFPQNYVDAALGALNLQRVPKDMRLSFSSGRRENLRSTRYFEFEIDADFIFSSRKDGGQVIYLRAFIELLRVNCRPPEARAFFARRGMATAMATFASAALGIDVSSKLVSQVLKEVFVYWGPPIDEHRDS